MTYAPQNTVAPYLSPDFFFPEDQEQWRNVLYNREYETAYTVNAKETATYDLIEIVTSQQWFTVNPPTGDPQFKRTGFRKVVNFGALPNAGTKSVAHGVTGEVVWTRIYATATNTSTLAAIPIPNFTPHGIEIDVDATNVNITTTVDETAFNVCYVVLEYLKSS